jgi:catechol 2,3-dioxygenase-like lactoylglutathione lyase family enzyme
MQTVPTTLAAKAWITIVAGFFSCLACAEQAHFHHVRLNVQDLQATADFYQKVFGATPVNFNNRTPGLFTERSFLLMNKVDKPATSNLKTAIWHIGWGGIDGPNEYQWWRSQGVEFYTPVTELGQNHYMYLYGPDKEVVEIYTGGKHHRFNHVHILASNPHLTAQWLQNTLELTDTQVRLGEDRAFVTVDNVQIIIYPNTERYRPKEQGETVLPTDDSAIAHIAFSFRDLSAAYQHSQQLQTAIESPIKTSDLHGLPSFFVRAPDGILIEMVEAKPLPEGIWE